MPGEQADCTDHFRSRRHHRGAGGGLPTARLHKAAMLFRSALVRHRQVQGMLAVLIPSQHKADSSFARTDRVGDNSDDICSRLGARDAIPRSVWNVPHLEQHSHRGVTAVPHSSRMRRQLRPLPARVVHDARPARSHGRVCGERRGPISSWAHSREPQVRLGDTADLFPHAPNDVHDAVSNLPLRGARRRSSVPARRESPRRTRSSAVLIPPSRAPGLLG